MKKLWIFILGFGAITFSSCSEERSTTESTTTTETTTITDTDTAGMSATTTTTNYDMEYNDRADRISSQMATDLRLDTATRTRVRDVFYNRSRRLGELDQQYYGNNVSGGVATRDTTGLYQQRQTINRETDAEFKGILSPQQYRSYETNRTKYDEMKFKSGDTKLKMEGDESKYKSGDSKMKTEGDESKIKTGDTKIKSETGESKYKSGDTKIKTETR